MSKNNQASNGNPKNKTVGRIVKRSIIAFFASLLVFATALILVLASIITTSPRSPEDEAIAQKIGSNLSNGDFLPFSGVKAHTNFIIFGVDKGGTRTDFMMAGSFNNKTGEVHLISLPRDTYVIMPKDRRDILKERNRWTPSGGEMKLTEVHHYSGEALGVEFSVKQIEELLQVKFEYYAKIDTESFRYLVDEIGGVEFDVPQRMYYRDPEQGLYIDLEPGLQTLNGSDAEGVIRYRKSDPNNPISKGYPEGDLGRVKTQQGFMRALITQLVSKDKLLSNLPAMLNTYIQYVTTNFNPANGVKYLPYLKGISSDKISTYTLPGSPQYIGNVSYFLADSVGIADLVDNLFYANEEREESSDLAIRVLNGGSVAGLAAKNRDYLEENGFTVESIGDYSGKRTAQTRIFVKNPGTGRDILALYPGGSIEIDQSLKDNEALVVLGTDLK